MVRMRSLRTTFSQVQGSELTVAVFSTSPATRARGLWQPVQYLLIASSGLAAGGLLGVHAREHAQNSIRPQAAVSAILGVDTTWP